MYEYSGTVVSVHDGDTATFDIDLGFRVFTRSALRLYAINAPELNTPEGKASRDYLMTLLPVGQKVTLTTLKGKEFDKYGRYLATVWLPTEPAAVNGRMVSAGFAKPWDGTGVKP